MGGLASKITASNLATTAKGERSSRNTKLADTSFMFQKTNDSPIDASLIGLADIKMCNDDDDDDMSERYQWTASTGAGKSAGNVLIGWLDFVNYPLVL